MTIDQNTDQEDMTAHKLVYVPHPSLEIKVPEFPEGNIEYRRAVASHMYDMMSKHRGIGIAANQINLNAAVFSMKIQGELDTMFNPEIHEVSDDKVLMTEGCLSDPGLYLKINRPDMIQASWENIEGERVKATLYGMDCRVFLHEYDHLQGILFSDRVKAPKLKMARKKQERALANFR